ncbi:OsmC family peroxiredoxin [Haloferax sp. MBLA0076]|uniref:OsmC family peroxiredoxin n=1 Tax=Haloferax litoreum TaxID=2666140 RepID=A0A6A8GMP8_9EURY|nr:MULTISPECIES: OsmC family protein [Haloferax]KAB1194453.1 OsmC family protein [Haloferax sp. CBA1148]MRX23020.1 OsmC family peroxiredoxin [Haloferax litoreum]
MCANHLETTSVEGSRIDAEAMRFETSTGNRFTIGDDGSPSEYLLGSLAACYNHVGHVVADEMGLELTDLVVTVEADTDPRGDDGAASGFREIRVSLDADTDADDETVAEWFQTTEARCPVCDTIFEATPSITAVRNRHDSDRT